MAGNALPQFCASGSLGTPQNMSAANTNGQGAGTIATDIYLLFTADATNGSLVEYVRIYPTASAAATNTAATVIRIFASSITTSTTTSANTHLLYEIAIPIVSADSASLAQLYYDVPLNIRLPASWTILATTHVVANANTAWKAVAVGGHF